MGKEWKFATSEQCKKLVEMGVVLETEKYWNHDMLVDKGVLVYSGHPKYPAPDVSELGELLPCGVESEKTFYHLFISKPKAGGSLVEYVFGVGETLMSIYKETEAQARCAALIWLIEHNQLTESLSLTHAQEQK